MGLSIIIAALLTAWLGTRVYRHQKAIDREEELRRLRAREYERFMGVLSQRWQHAKWPPQERTEKWREHVDQYNTARWNLFLVASDEVIRTAVKLDWHIVGTKRTSADYVRLYMDVLFAMRADSFLETGLDRNEIGRMLPLKHNIPFNYPPELAQHVLTRYQEDDKQSSQYQTQKSDPAVDEANNSEKVSVHKPMSQSNKAPQRSWWRRMFQR